MLNESEIMKILEDHEKRIRELEKLYKSEEEPRIHKMGESEEGVKKLAKKTGVVEEKIKEVFDLEEDVLTLVKIIGEGDKEKTKNITLLTLLGYKYFSGRNELPSQEIKRNVVEHNIPVNNFATYLNEMIPSLLRRFLGFQIFITTKNPLKWAYGSYG